MKKAFIHVVSGQYSGQYTRATEHLSERCINNKELTFASAGAQRLPLAAATKKVYLFFLPGCDERVPGQTHL